MGFAALVLVACSGPRKASERACLKADRHMAKAAWLCPKVLEADTTARTVTVELPGDTLQVAPKLAHSLDVDSILAACDQLREALAAERTLRELAPPSGGQPTPVVSRPPAVPRALSTLQDRACQWEPFEVNHELAVLRLRPGSDGRPLITVEVKPRVATGECPPCPPVLKLERKVMQGVNPVWKTIGQVAIGVAALLLLSAALIVYLAWRHRG